MSALRTSDAGNSGLRWRSGRSWLQHLFGHDVGRGAFGFRLFGRGAFGFRLACRMGGVWDRCFWQPCRAGSLKVQSYLCHFSVWAWLLALLFIFCLLLCWVWLVFFLRLPGFHQL